MNIYKIVTIVLTLFNEEILQFGLHETCYFLECETTCNFRNLFPLVLDAVYCTPCAQNQGKPLRKTSSQYTVIHRKHSPTLSWIQIVREARIYEYLSYFKNTLQKYIIYLRFHGYYLICHYLPIPFLSLISDL